VSIEWGCRRDEDIDAGEWEDEESGLDADRVAVELAAGHYGRTIRALARHPEIASAYLARREAGD
jgi:hypothetical protein